MLFFERSSAGYFFFKRDMYPEILLQAMYASGLLLQNRIGILYLFHVCKEGRNYLAALF